MSKENEILSNKVANTTSDRDGEDITDEIEVDKEDIGLYRIRELAPKSAPITVPYLEVYRTNELEYIPYISPYNVGCSSSSDTTSSESGDDSNSSDGSTDTDTGSSDNSSSSDSTNTTDDTGSS